MIFCVIFLTHFINEKNIGSSVCVRVVMKR